MLFNASHCKFSAVYAYSLLLPVYDISSQNLAFAEEKMPQKSELS